MTKRTHICCIVPPHILRAIAEHGNPQQKELAFKTLTLSEQLRGRRQAVGAFHVAMAAGVEHRTTYDAHNGTDLPGTKVRDEGDSPSSDSAVNEAYDGAGATYDLYHDIYERNSIDDRGIPIISTVHYDRDFDNAFWDGQQMVYGDGDGRIFVGFTKSIDVIGHELTHGVTQYEAGLIYSGQPGALNESMSDVFGTLLKQRVNKQKVDQADWLIGQGILGPNINGVALRSMKAPGTAYDDPMLGGKDPQPAHMKDYKNIGFDNGGVHINSGIPNHAFYLVAMEIGGYAWEKAGKIWYVTLRDRLRPKSSFQTAANKTFHVAGELFGVGSKEQEAVRKGWASVGIKVK